jgi:uncharacterized membrane protein YgaE (UPF0421/DUF939 family)
VIGVLTNHTKFKIMTFNAAMKVFCGIKLFVMLAAIYYWWTYTERRVLSFFGLVFVGYFVGFILGLFVVLPFTKIPEEKPESEKDFNDKLADMLRVYVNQKTKQDEVQALVNQASAQSPMNETTTTANYYGKFY